MSQRFTTKDIEKIEKSLSNKLPHKRYVHTLGVRYTAQCLAMRYGEDINKTGVAASLHDCAKYMSGEKMLQKCIKYKIPISEVEQENPSLLHAKLGAYYARSRFEIRDEEVLSAITYHTTGKPDMTMLEKIVFLADFMEPGRKMIPDLDVVRSHAFVDIDEAVYLTLSNTIKYLESQKLGNNVAKLFDPMTKAAFEYYRDLRKEMEK